MEVPNEKKSTAGTEDASGGAVRAGGLVLPPSSTDIFDLPFVKEGGRKENGVDNASGIDASCSLEGRDSDSSRSASSSASPPLSRCDILVDAGARVVLNTNPGPVPPPKTRSGTGSVGFFCFGTGSMDNNDDSPAPDSNRGFFAAGLSSFKSSLLLSSVAVRVGRLIVIFFGPRFGGRAVLEVRANGGGRGNAGFLEGKGSFAANDDLAAVDVVVVSSFSVSLLLP